MHSGWIIFGRTHGTWSYQKNQQETQISVHRQNSYLTPSPRLRLLCNALIKSHFDYSCSTWFPNLNKKLQKKLQVMQNKCIRFCLQLDSRAHIGSKELKAINWLPVCNRFQQCILFKVFKFFNKCCPFYMSDIFSAKRNSLRTRHSHLNLAQPHRKTKFSQAALSYLGPSIWNSIPNSIKESQTLNTFKHKVKDFYLNNFVNSENDVFVFWESVFLNISTAMEIKHLWKLFLCSSWPYCTQGSSFFYLLYFYCFCIIIFYTYTFT